MQEVYVQRAISANPYLIFPHRIETGKVLESLMTGYTHWKFNYYLALIYWNKGLTADARKLMLACQNEPDFSPFYLAKSRLFADHPDMQLHALQQALSLTPNDWRSNLAYARKLFEEGQFEEVVAIGEKFADKSPAMALLYARALIHTNAPEKAVAFLKNYTLLPFEGASEARAVYHEACIRTAMAYYTKGDYKKAANFAEIALEWPKNLGVGKPYEVDNRMDYFVLYQSMAKLGRKNVAADYRDLLIEQASELSPNLIFQALALRDKQEPALGETLLELLSPTDSAWILSWFKGEIPLPENTANPDDALVLDLLKNIR